MVLSIRIGVIYSFRRGVTDEPLIARCDARPQVETCPEGPSCGIHNFPYHFLRNIMFTQRKMAQKNDEIDIFHCFLQKRV